MIRIISWFLRHCYLIVPMPCGIFLAFLIVLLCFQRAYLCYLRGNKDSIFQVIHSNDKGRYSRCSPLPCPLSKFIKTKKRRWVGALSVMTHIHPYISLPEAWWLPGAGGRNRGGLVKGQKLLVIRWKRSDVLIFNGDYSWITVLRNWDLLLE